MLTVVALEGHVQRDDRTGSLRRPQQRRYHIDLIDKFDRTFVVLEGPVAPPLEELQGIANPDTVEARDLAEIDPERRFGTQHGGQVRILVQDPGKVPEPVTLLDYQIISAAQLPTLLPDDAERAAKCRSKKSSRFSST